MKRIIGLLIIGVLLALTLAYSGNDRYEGRLVLTKTGIAGGSDSLIVDTFELIPVTKFSNQLLGIFIMDSVRDVPNSGGWGIRDTIDLVFKSSYAGRYTTLDSVRKAVITNVLTTLLVVDGIIFDSLYGERIDLIVRLNDTTNTGVATDSVARVNINYQILHKFRE